MSEQVLKLITPHYKYKLTLKESLKPLHKFTFIVGNKENVNTAAIEIKNDLEKLLTERNFTNVKEAVGYAHKS